MKLNDFSNYVLDFSDFLDKNNYSFSTKSGYVKALNDFIEYLQRNNLNLDVLLMKDVNHYFESLSQRIGNNTINGYISALKKFFSFVKKYKGVFLRFDINEITMYKLDTRIREGLSANEVQIVIDKLFNNSSIKSKRELILLLTILQTGMKIEELRQLTRDCVLENAIKTESNKYWINDVLMRLFCEYFKMADELGISSQYVFTSFSANQSKNKCLTRRSIEMIVRKHFKNCFYNDLRLMFFQKLIDDSVDIQKIHKHEVHPNVYELNDILRVVNE